MPLSLQNIGDAGTDATFLARVRGRLAQAAPAVLGESAGTANHAARVTHMANVLREPQLYAARYASYVAGQSGPSSAANLAAVTDAQITTAVDSLIDHFALNAP